VDMAPRVLGIFADQLSQAGKERLEKLSVEVRLGHGVDQIDGDGVVVAGERIPSKTVIWTAGVAPSPAGKWLEVETDRAGRVRVQKDLSVPGHADIFVIGDTASLDQDATPRIRSCESCRFAAPQNPCVATSYPMISWP
jgi:NADH:ubiquinone reductase (H+-translocating)